MNELSFSCGISKSINDPHVHHQLFLKTFIIEKPPYTLLQEIQDGLRAHKHNITESDEHAEVQAVVEIVDGDIYGKSDPRKHGWPEGF